MSNNTKSVNTTNDTTNTTTRIDLSKLLGIEQKEVIKQDRTLNEKEQVMSDINKHMHEMLIKNHSQFYKEIQTDVVVKKQDDTYDLKRVSGYYLLFPKKVTLTTKDNKEANYDGFSICKPVIYVKGGRSYECLDFTVIGKTTFNK